jgi:DNA-binding MarR family transcriptional regulator
MSEALADERQQSAESLARAAEVYLALGRIIRWLRHIDGNHAMTAGCSSALGTVAQNGPMRLRDLAAAEGVTPPTMSRIVNLLETSGHLVRTADPTDARAAMLEITEEGRALVNGVKSIRVQALAEVLDGLPEGQGEVVSAALTTMEAELRGRK